jgi:hypothetical protein
MPDRGKEKALTVLGTYRVARMPLYIVGTFDTGVTVLSQQVRALNLVWALIESGLIPSGHHAPTAASDVLNVAIVGSGFAGLSIAAGLMKKGADVRITIFEQRDTLTPCYRCSKAATRAGYIRESMIGPMKAAKPTLQCCQF